MKTENPSGPSIEEILRIKFIHALDTVRQERLPGWSDYLATTPEAFRFIDSQWSKITRAIQDEDEVLFERALAGWRKGWARVNYILAERYREKVPDIEQQELRYLKWMKIQYIKLECKLGVFYLVPQRPSRKPRVQHWYTVDEMIDILGSPATVGAIKAFKTLPVRPGMLENPVKGEKHLVIDTDNKKVYYRFKGSNVHE